MYNTPFNNSRLPKANDDNTTVVLKHSGKCRFICHLSCYVKSPHVVISRRFPVLCFLLLKTHISGVGRLDTARHITMPVLPTLGEAFNCLNSEKVKAFLVVLLVCVPKRLKIECNGFQQPQFGGSTASTAVKPVHSGISGSIISTLLADWTLHINSIYPT